MIRVSSSSLDNFARMQRGGETYPGSGPYTEDMLIRDLTTETNSVLAAIGTGFHAIAREPEMFKQQAGCYVYDDPRIEKTFRFTKSPMDMALAPLRESFPGYNSQWEIKSTLEFSFTGGREVCLVGQADIIQGLKIGEIKTSKYPIQPSKFTDSWQWRAYLEIFGADAVEYWMYKLKVGSFDIITELCAHPMTMLRYPKLSSDLEGIIEDFAFWAYAQPKVLEHLLKRQLENGDEANKY